MMIIIISSVLTSTLEQTKLIFPRWSSSPIVHILFRFFLQTKSFSCIIFSSGFSTMVQSFLFSSVENEEKIFLINSWLRYQLYRVAYWSNGIIAMSSACQLHFIYTQRGGWLRVCLQCFLSSVPLPPPYWEAALCLIQVRAVKLSGGSMAWQDHHHRWVWILWLLFLFCGRPVVAWWRPSSAWSMMTL